VADEGTLEQLARPIEQPPPRTSSRLTHTIAFRCNDEQMIAAEALRQTFPSATWAEAMQWIFSSKEGRELIARRVKGEI
jgi:hypothetical protein